MGLGLLFGNGAASYISRLLGRGEKEAADKVASTALYSSLFVGAVMILCSLIFLKPILKLLGATESILPYAVTYTAIYVTSSIFNIFNVTMNNIVTSEGAAKTTMCALLTGAVLNMALDPIFIYALHLGCCRRGNCNRHFTGCIHACISVLCAQEKKCFQLSYQEMLFFQENYVRNTENRNPHAGVPAADQPVHHPD